MSSFLTLAFFYILFFIFFSLTVFVSLKTIEVLFALRRLPSWRIALVYSFLYQIVIFDMLDLNGDLHRWLLNLVGLVSFGFFYGLIALAVYGLSRLLVPRYSRDSVKWGRAIGLVYVLAIVVSIALGVYNFHKPEAVVNYRIASDKISKPVRFVMFSDMQYGSISKQEMEEKMQRIYALKPEFIVFVGDLIDFDHYSTEDFAILEKSPVPIFFERGNHELYHDPTRLLSDLKGISKLELLINDMSSIGEIDVIGIDYSREPDHLKNQLAQLPIDNKRFSILLYHEPRDVEVGASFGLDLLLFGHTHGGQIWPYTIIVDWMYKYADGYFEIGDSTVYTSDGVALWGPRMRLGSQNEIVVFSLEPEA